MVTDTPLLLFIFILFIQATVDTVNTVYVPIHVRPSTPRKVKLGQSYERYGLQISSGSFPRVFACGQHRRSISPVHVILKRLKKLKSDSDSNVHRVADIVCSA